MVGFIDLLNIRSRIIELMILELFAAHGETHRSALLVLQLELDERGLREEVESVGLDVTSCNSDRLDRLIHRLRTDGLHLHLALITQKRGDRTGDRVGTGASRDT